MFTRICGFAIVGIILCTFGFVEAGGDKEKAKDKKFEVPKDAVVGKVKSVDMKASSFTITLRNGKPRTFAVDDKTEFWGPKGGDRGTGAKGLKDDAMAAGYVVHVMPAKDTKVAKDVYLSERKEDK